MLAPLALGEIELHVAAEQELLLLVGYLVTLIVSQHVDLVSSADVHEPSGIHLWWGVVWSGEVLCGEESARRGAGRGRGESRHWVSTHNLLSCHEEGRTDRH